MQNLVARVAMFGIVVAASIVQSEARGGHGVQPTIHDGRGIPYRKNFGYYGPKWRQWPGDQPVAPDMPLIQPSGPAAPQLPAVDVPPPADEVRKSNPIQAGPQETVEPPSDPLPSTVLPTVPAPRDGVETPPPEQAPQPARPPVRRPGARNGARVLPAPENDDDRDAPPPRLTHEANEEGSAAATFLHVSTTTTQRDLTVQGPASPATIETAVLEVPAQQEELNEEIDLQQAFDEDSETTLPAGPSSTTAAPRRPSALGPGEAHAAFAVATTENDARDNAVQLRYRAINGKLVRGIQPSMSVLAVTAEVGDERPSEDGASLTANMASSARQPQREYARPSQNRVTVHTSARPARRVTTANPLRCVQAGAASAGLTSSGEKAVQVTPSAAPENPMISHDNPMRKPETAAAGTNPLRQ